MDTLIETYNRLLSEQKPIYHRRFYDEFKFDHRVVGIVGARGVGKTTFLFDYLKKNFKDSDKALYVSADHLYFSDHTLLDLADQFYKLFGGQLLCIDEIHRYPNWNQELKNIYDSYPKMKVIFSGSSSISIVKGKYDLSRRALLRSMPGFSFREFLSAKTGKRFDVISFNDLLEKGSSISKKISNTEKLMGYFKEYLKEGYYPIFTELHEYASYRDALIGIIDKVVYEDISALYSLKTANLETIRKIVYFIATSRPGSINVNKLANSLGKDHTTVCEYLEMLRESRLLRYLLNDKKGHSLIRNAEKIYLNDTNLMYAVNNSIQKDVEIGTMRELFVVTALEDACFKPFYSEEGDIRCNSYTFEIDGKGKGESQIRGVKNSFLVKDDSLIASGNSIPLYLFGFLS